MNGDELLSAFMRFILKEKPRRFFHGYDVPERPPCYYEWYHTYNKRVFPEETNYHLYFESDCEPCKLRKKLPELKAEFVTEGCYGAYDAVLFISINGVIDDVFPIEAKGNTDTLDDRLREQIFIAVKNYGKSILLLDNEQAYKVKKWNLHKMLPCEIWCWNGTTFEALTEPIVRYHNSGNPEISARAIEHATGIHNYSQLKSLRLKFRHIQGLIATLAYNQWNWKDERKFTPEEAKLFYELIGVPLNRKKLKVVEEQTVKITKTVTVEKQTITTQQPLFEQNLLFNSEKVENK
jgi:hypothetical protein